VSETGPPPTGPAPDTATLERLVARLEESAARLRGGELSPESAAELERLARAAASEPTTDPPIRSQLP